MSRPSTPVPLTCAPDWAPFGREVRALRKAAGLTQVQAAERADMSLRWFKYLEAGTRRPRLEDVVRLAILDPLTGRMAASVLQSLTPAGDTPSGPRLAVAHLARLSAWPLEALHPSVAEAVTPEALAVVADVLTVAHALVDRVAPDPADLETMAAARNVRRVVRRLDVVHAALTAEDTP